MIMHWVATVWIQKHHICLSLLVLAEAENRPQPSTSRTTETPDRKNWRYRPPPRGLTSQEYTQCPRYFGIGSCRVGNQCSQAHSAEELQEWRERFELNKQESQKSREDGNSNRGYQYLQAIVKKMINAENTKSLVVIFYTCLACLDRTANLFINLWK